jgi:hypothetical protein
MLAQLIATVALIMTVALIISIAVVTAVSIGIVRADARVKAASGGPLPADRRFHRHGGAHGSGICLACLYEINFVDIQVYGAVMSLYFPVRLQDGEWPPEGKLSSSSISPRGFYSLHARCRIAAQPFTPAISIRSPGAFALAPAFDPPSSGGPGCNLTISSHTIRSRTVS